MALDTCRADAAVIVCDYCGRPADVHVFVDLDAWYEASRGRTYDSVDEVAAWYATSAVSRYVCHGHERHAYDHVVHRVQGLVEVRTVDVRRAGDAS